jgi:hypothetical protein
MTFDIDADDAELLIAVLLYAEGAATLGASANPAIADALQFLRPFRSRLIEAILRVRLGHSTAERKPS